MILKKGSVKLDNKTCPNCKSSKEISEFAKSKIHRLGVDCWCKKCRAEKQRERTKLGIGSRNKEYIKDKRIRDKKSWFEYLNSKNPSPKCEVCGKELKYFNGKYGVAFDHKNSNAPIKGCPSNWLYDHRPTERSIKIWEDSNFGILCIDCNSFLPTNNRKQWLVNLTKYVEDRHNER